MGLVDKLEKRAKELDRSLSCGLYDNRDKFADCYDLQAAEDRELLEQAAKVIRHLEKIEVFHLLRQGKFC